jgi:hypothetical protein
MPRRLRRDLPGFSIRTAQEEGWAAFKNGELLRRAEGSFDVLVTIDQRIPKLRAAIESVGAGEIVVVKAKSA